MSVYTTKHSWTRFFTVQQHKSKTQEKYNLSGVNPTVFRLCVTESVKLFGTDLRFFIKESFVFREI